MTADRLREYLDRMHEAAEKACAFLADMSEDQFLADERTQMAVGMALVLIGEAAERIMTHYPDFPVDHPGIPWSKIRGMRNLVAYDYYEVELPVIWETVRKSLPDLIYDLDNLRHWRAQGE
jgi:uncharacterized protein with HEPN domain